MSNLVLITGIDNSTIARMTCKKFLEKGYDAIVTYEKDFSEGDENRNSFEELIGDNKITEYLKVNLRDKDSVLALLESLKKYTFDVIVNCPTILATTKSGGLRDEFTDFDYDNFNEVISYNITAITSICIGLKDNIKAGGSIVNVTSSAAEEGAFATISYNASKAAVKNVTKSLANNFGGYNNVKVNSVAPGWVPPNSEVVEGSTLSLANSITPLDRCGTPEDVADMIINVAENSFSSGCDYPVHGGITSSYLMYLIETLELRGIKMNDMNEVLLDIFKKNAEGLKQKKI